MRVIIRWQPGSGNNRLSRLLTWVGPACVLAAVLQTRIVRNLNIVLPNTATRHTGIAVPAILPADLIVSEVGFVGPPERRTFAGTLENRSGKTYTNVQMTFSLVGRDGDMVGSAAATVNHIEGHHTAKFETPDVTPKGVEIVLNHIEGQVPAAGAP